MELLSVKQKSPKQSKKTNKKKPFKIVYISNPVKFTASPDQFRSVVQQLTGKHSTAVNLPGAYGEVADISTIKDVNDGYINIPAKPQSEHQMNMSDWCHNLSASGSSYGDIEAVIDIPELFMSYDYIRYDTYAEAGLGLSKV